MGKLLKIIIALVVIAVAAFIIRSIFFANVDVENVVEGALERADTVVEDIVDSLRGVFYAESGVAIDREDLSFVRVAGHQADFRLVA